MNAVRKWFHPTVALLGLANMVYSVFVPIGERAMVFMGAGALLMIAAVYTDPRVWELDDG